MRDFLGRNVRFVLCTVLTLTIAFNLFQILSGQYLSAIPAGIQIAVLYSVYTAKSWAHIAIRIWSFLLIVAGASLWLSALIGGPAFFYSIARVIVRTTVLLLGIYFFVYAKRALPSDGIAI